jgi:hypothetical protein
MQYSVGAHSVVVGRLVAGWLGLAPNPWTNAYGSRVDRANEQIQRDLGRIPAYLRLLVHRAAVLHDASEYVLRDMARDVKRALRSFPGAGYDVLEANLMQAVSEAVGLSVLWEGEWASAAQNIVKAADDEALAGEVAVLWPTQLRERFKTPEAMHYTKKLVSEAAAWSVEETQRAMTFELLESAFTTWGHCTTAWRTY